MTPVDDADQSRQLDELKQRIDQLELERSQLRDQTKADPYRV